LPKVQSIAGVDVAFVDDEAVCAVCVFNYPKLNLVETTKAKNKISFPYVPGLLTFREGPIILCAFRKLKNKPDLVLFDGQGICHPRQMGIATHMGIILNIPSIGCAKSSLYGIYEMPEEDKGSYSFIYDKDTKEILGVALRTRRQVKPLFVSCGYKITLSQAITLILEFCPKYRIPEPLRYAHNFSRKDARGELSI